jgi:hypothetical protein
VTPQLLLRIAAGLTLVHAVLHTIGGVFGKQASGPQQAVAEVMKSTQFPMMGVTRTFWEFYQGMGLAVSIFLTIEAVLFWQLASIALANRPLIRPILITFLLGYLVLAVVSYVHFFAAPAIFEVLIALCLGLALRS